MKKDEIKTMCKHATPNDVPAIVATLKTCHPEDVADVLRDVKTDKSSPWWVILLKVIVYAIGLVLAGYGTTAAAQTLNIL